MSPSRVMSRPTEIMFVANATSTCSLSANGNASLRFVSETLFVLSRDVSSATSRAIARSAKLPSTSLMRFWLW